jgi:phosphomannomutase
MKKIYLFDVDGTLTVAKEAIDPYFAKEFFKWMQDKEVYIVSGGTFVRIIGQLGTEITNKTSGVFACMANVFLQKIEHVNETGYDEWETVYENIFKPPGRPDKFYAKLDSIVKESSYPVKTGNHHELRTGMVNFSIVGRNANTEQRKAYTAYDKENLEREKIVATLKKEYSELDFVIGGAVSIDIFNIGNDKSQIIDRYFEEALEHNEIIFVGDRIPFPGNDHPLATALRQHPNGSAYEVKDWQDTAELLKSDPFA